jgi:hypothetical protein
MKWLTYAAAANFAMLLPEMSLPADSAWYQAVDALSTLVGAGVPVGIAVMRYRLYEIDTIINRTLVYGSLTVMLALIYFGAWRQPRRYSVRSLARRSNRNWPWSSPP